jgi:hypothetical protein
MKLEINAAYDVADIIRLIAADLAANGYQPVGDWQQILTTVLGHDYVFEFLVETISKTKLDEILQSGNEEVKPARNRNQWINDPEEKQRRVQKMVEGKKAKKAARETQPEENFQRVEVAAPAATPFRNGSNYQ